MFDFLLELLFEELPRKVGVAICAAIGAGIAGVGFALRSHYQHRVGVCTALSCGFDELMSKVGLGIGIAGLVIAVPMLIWLLRLFVAPTPDESG